MPFFSPMCGRKPVVFAFGLVCLIEHDKPQFYSFPANNTEPGACHLARVSQLTGRQDLGSTFSPKTNTRLTDIPLLFPYFYVYSGDPDPSDCAFMATTLPTEPSYQLKSHMLFHVCLQYGSCIHPSMNATGLLPFGYYGQ